MASGFSARARHTARSGAPLLRSSVRARARIIYRDRPAARRTAAGAARYRCGARGARALLELSQLFRALNTRTRAARPGPAQLRTAAPVVSLLQTRVAAPL